MTQAIDAHRWTIGSLLGRYERRPVVLPPFQRAFSWERPQITVFWEDLINFESAYTSSPLTASYFLGSIVVIESDEQILLLDGQQRLATATIALAAMRDTARSLDTSSSTKGGDFTVTFSARSFRKIRSPPLTHSLSANSTNHFS